MSSSSSSASVSADSTLSGSGTVMLVAPNSGVDSAVELTLTLSAPSSAAAAPQKRTGLVLVVDRSGSMAGNFERQVVPSLIYVAERSFELGVPVRLVLYDSNAEIIQYTRENYKAVIGRLRVTGSTSFRNAFAKTWDAVKELPPGLDSVVIGFLTDGQNTDAPYDAALADLQQNLRKCQFASVCHSIAFSAGHDFAFLNKLRIQLGTVEGGFQYADPSDGPQALEEKLSAVFDVAASNRTECRLTIAVDRLRFVVSDAAEDALLDALVVTERVKFGAEFTVRALCRAPADLVQVDALAATISCAVEGGGAPLAPLALQLAVRAVPKEKTGSLRAQQNLARLERLEQECGAAASAGGKVDVTQLSARLNRAIADMAALQSSAELFSLCPTKNARRAMLELIQQFSTKSAEIAQIIATLSSGSLTNAQKARLSELAHGQQFKQARRQRDLDQRSARNVETLNKAEAALLAVQVDAEQLKQVSDEAASEFRCVLTQESWRDLVAEPDAADRDVICFGLAVQRPESIVDDPTQLRVRDVSVTTVGHAAFEDAVIYKLATDDRFARSDTFSVAGDLAVALRGQGREPINACMPLYIHAEHWKVVVPQLPAMLGYLCCLDPLGYNSNQSVVFFLVLGNMAMSLRNPGEKELRLLLQFHRTAIAVLHDCKLLKRAEEAVAQFIASPASRLKDVTPNLVVLVGQLMCLPTATVDALLPTAEAWRKFWLDVFAESLRRAADGIYPGDKADDAAQLVSAIIDGNVDAQPPLSDNELAGNDFFDTKRGAPSAAPKAPRPSDGANADDDDDGAAPAKNAPAKAKAAPAKAAAKAAAVAGAPAKVCRLRLRALPTGVVVDAALERAMLAEARALLSDEAAQSTSDAAADADKWKVEIVTASMLAALRAFDKALGPRAFPSVASLISLATYARAFHTLARDRGSVAALAAEIDAAAGVASVELCNAVKAAFVRRADFGHTLPALFAALNDPQCGGAHEPSQTVRSVAQQLRAIVARSVQLRVNKTAREACLANTDGAGSTPQAANELIAALHVELAVSAKTKDEKKSKSRLLDQAILSSLSTDNLRVFVGFLVSAQAFGGTRFTEQFATLVQRLSDRDLPVALWKEKLDVLLSGRFNGVNVLDGGSAWIPGNRLHVRFCKKFSEKEVGELLSAHAARFADEQKQREQQSAAKKSAAASSASSSSSSASAKKKDPKKTNAAGAKQQQQKKKK